MRRREIATYVILAVAVVVFTAPFWVCLAGIWLNGMREAIEFVKDVWAEFAP